MDFKKYFISFIDSILEVDKDNKYALKYKNNAEFLKYNELSKCMLPQHQIIMAKHGPINKYFFVDATLTPIISNKQVITKKTSKNNSFFCHIY